MKLNIPKYGHDLWHVAVRPAGVLALLYALTAFGGGAAYDYYKDSRKARTDRVIDLAQSFSESTKEFDALVAAMANGIMDSNQPDVVDRSKLIRNLNEQYSQIDELQPLVSKDALNQYKKSLSQLNATLPEVNNVQAMKNYWSQVSDVLMARRTLRAELNKKAGMSLD